MLNKIKYLVFSFVFINSAIISAPGDYYDRWDKTPAPQKALFSLLMTGVSATLVNKVLDTKTIKSITGKANISNSEIKLLTALETILLTLAPLSQKEINGVKDEGFYYYCKRLPLLYLVSKLVNTKLFQEVIGAIPLGIGDELKFETSAQDDVPNKEVAHEVVENSKLSDKRDRRHADWLRMIIQSVALYVPAESIIFKNR